MVLITMTTLDMSTEDVILERFQELLLGAIGFGCEDVIACERRPSCLDLSCQTFHYFAGTGGSLSEDSTQRVIVEFEFRMENEVEFSQCMASRPVPAANSGSLLVRRPPYVVWLVQITLYPEDIWWERPCQRFESYIYRYLFTWTFENN